MDPHDSRLVDHVTEYSATLGSSSFSDGHWPGMDTTKILFAIKQGPRSLENHIREFLAIAHYSELLDIILIEIFCDGINPPLKSKLRRKGPRSSLSQFLDYALLSVGSSFTVGVAEEERDMSAIPERTHIMAATTTLCHVTAAIHESNQVTDNLHESHHVSADLPESHHVSADLPVSPRLR